MNRVGVVYEVRFDVEDAERFRRWFPGAVVEWGIQPGVERVRTYRGIDGEREWIRVAFGFEAYEDWTAFVGRQLHQEPMADLEQVATTVETSLWTPAAVRLTGGDAVVVDADGVEGLPVDTAGGAMPSEDAVPEP